MQWAAEWASRQSRRWLVEVGVTAEPAKTTATIWYGRLYEATVGASQRQDECVGASQRDDEWERASVLTRLSIRLRRALRVIPPAWEALAQPAELTQLAPRVGCISHVFEGVASNTNSECVCLNKRKKSVQSNDAESERI